MTATGHPIARHRSRAPVLRVPIVDRTLYAATALALVHVTVQTYRDSAAQATHYPPWLVAGTTTLMAILSLWVAASTIRGVSGTIRLTSVQVLVVTAVAVGGLSAITASDLAAQPGMPWQLHLLVIGSCVSVLAFGMRFGMVVVALIWAEFFVLRSSHGLVQAASESMAFLAGGAFCGALIYVVRHGAELVERADRNREQVRASTTLVQHRQAASEWWDRFIHDTVLGALLLAGRGAADDARTRTAATRMAKDALDALHGRRTPSGYGMPNALLVAHAHSLGLTVSGAVRDVGAPPLVRDEVVDAAKEAITNVARHAGATHVFIDGDLSVESAVVYISDEGSGFDPERSTDRLGVRESLERRMVVLGGAARVESEPGVGTTVHISWHRTTTPGPKVVWPQEPYAVLGIPLFLYCALHGVAGLLFGHTPNGVATILGMIGLVVVVTGVIDRRLPDRVVAPIVGSLPLVVAVLTIFIEPMEVPDFRTWFVGACVPIFIGLVMRGRRRLAFGISLSCMMTFIVVGHVAGTVPLAVALNVSAQQPLLTLGAIAISLTLDRSAEHIVRLNRETVAARAALDVIRARESERRSRLDELASDVEPLLHRLADDSPITDQDRAAYREVEAHVRDGLTGRALLSGVVRGAVAQVRGRGGEAVLTSADSAVLPHGLWPSINEIVAQCAQICGLGSVLTVRLTGTDARGQCTVAVADPIDQPKTMMVHSVPEGAVAEESSDEDSVLVTLRWPTPSHPTLSDSTTPTAGVSS